LLHNLSVTGSFISRAVFTPDGNRLLTTDSAPTNSLRLWDLAREQTIRSFGNRVQALGIVAGGYLVAAGDAAAVNVWDIETGEVIRPLSGATQLVIDLASSANSSTVIAGCLDGRVITWDASTGAVLHNFVGERLVAMRAIPGTNQIITGHADKLVRVKNS
jgi:WD40 repeat protein